MKTVGILGAGQLGCMLSEALHCLGAKVHFYDPSPYAPGKYRTPFFHQGAWQDKEKLQRFFQACDVVTYEFENVDPKHLKNISTATGTPIFPSPDVLEITQERQKEKTFLLENKLPLTPFFVVNTKEELLSLRGKIVAPMIAKSLRGGYDGKGQRGISSDSELDALIPLLPLVLESKLNIFCEASVITGRNLQGDVVQFPIFENIHRDHILDISVVPSYSVSEKVGKVLLELAKKSCELVGGGTIGLLTTEFFICTEPPPPSFLKGELMAVDSYFIGINEFAPRAHNSGHVSRKACTYSQFDVLAHILLDLPLPQEISMTNPTQYYGMGNILGETWLRQAKNKNAQFGDTVISDADKALNLSLLAHHPNILETYLYSKPEAKQKRKMGHFIGTGNSPENVRSNLENFKAELENLKPNP